MTDDEGATQSEEGDTASDPEEVDTPDPEGTDPGDDRALTAGAFYDALEATERPVVTASEVAREIDRSHAETTDLLAELPQAEDLAVDSDPVVWYPEDVSDLAERERVVPFPDRRQIVVHHPEQYTLARLSQFARLVTASGEGGYIYEIRDADVWAAPFDDLGELLAAIRKVAGRWPSLEEFVRSQYERARKFRLRSEEDYTVLEAASEDLMGNVAQQKLDDDLVRGLISDTEAWVVEGEEAEIKRTLYEAGYPVSDDRELEAGDDLPLELQLELREYQRDWVDRFTEKGAGVLVGPPGSGKTVAAMGIMEQIEGETLILVPSRELAGQWHDELLTHTSLGPDDVGEYHGGAKELRPVTIATYQTAGMDRHRKLFDARRWGLIVYDEVQHLPAPVSRRSADLQGKHRVGLSVDGDTVVVTKRGTEITTERIEDFVSRYVGDTPGSAAVDDVETLGVTKDGTVEWTPIQAAMRHENTKDLYTVRSSNGRQITVTEDHSLIVLDGDRATIAEKPPTELGDDDYLLQPATVPGIEDADTTFDVLSRIDEGYVLLEDGVEESVFAPLYEESVGTNKDRYNWKSRRSLPVSVAREIGVDREHIEGVYVRKRDQHIPPTVDVEDFARLVGLFVADGSIDGHRVNFYADDSPDNSEVRRFASIIQRVVPEADLTTVANGQNCTTVRVSGPLAQVIKNVGLENGARKKFVPPFVLSNRAAQEAFLEGIVLGDGHRQDRGRGREQVTVSTSSHELAQGLNLVLSSLGYVGGNYRRRPEVGIREESHDVVENNLVRYNPRNDRKLSRNEMVPFTRPLQKAYDSIERVEVDQRPHGVSAGAIQSGLARRSRLNPTELETIVGRAEMDRLEWLVDVDFAMLEVDSVTEASDEKYVYDISTGTDNFLGNHLFCHNSATPVREDDQESEIFTLVGPPIGTDWTALFEAGYVAEPEVEIRYVPWADDGSQDEYAAAHGHERRQVAASNPAKIREIRRIRSANPDAKGLVFVDWLDQGREIADALEVPFISGDTRHAERARLFEEFRRGERDLLVVSRVGDEGIDLPDAELAIVASGLGGSRRQGTQRAGRTMRPAGRASMYVLATRGTEEEDFARRRMRHLAGKGVHITETEAEPPADERTADE